MHLLGPTPDSEQSQWFTPDWLAERVVEWASPQKKDLVLELGAGNGAFVRPLLAMPGVGILAIERDERFAAELRKMQRLENGLTVVHGDALGQLPSWVADWPREQILSIGNPPYEDDLDIAFIEQAFLYADRVVAVLRLTFLAGQARYERIWSKHTLSRIAYLPARPAFVGETSGGAKTDFAVFDIRRGRSLIPTNVLTEWWAR